MRRCCPKASIINHSAGMASANQSTMRSTVEPPMGLFKKSPGTIMSPAIRPGLMPTPSFCAIKYLTATHSLTGILGSSELLCFCKLRINSWPFLCCQWLGGLLNNLLGQRFMSGPEYKPRVNAEELARARRLAQGRPSPGAEDGCCVGVAVEAVSAEGSGGLRSSRTDAPNTNSTGNAKAPETTTATTRVTRRWRCSDVVESSEGMRRWGGVGSNLVSFQQNLGTWQVRQIVQSHTCPLRA